MDIDTFPAMVGRLYGNPNIGEIPEEAKTTSDLIAFALVMETTILRGRSQEILLRVPIFAPPL